MLKKVLTLTMLCLFCSLGGFMPRGAQAQDSEAHKTQSLGALGAQERAELYGLDVQETRDVEKAGRFELALSLGVIATDIFVVYLPVTLRAAYHFNEDWALELSASYMGCFSSKVGATNERAAAQHCMRFFTPTYDRLKGAYADDTQVRHIQVKQWQSARFHLNGAWSPIYGKLSIEDRFITYFDLQLTAGLGMQLAESVDDDKTLRFHPLFEGNLGVTLRFLFTEHVGLRLDYRSYLFPKLFNKGLGHAAEFSIGLSLFI